ncbi:hypothetical protein HDU97_004751 [Phlyctochytrium planicorne]|nr:hypothetical protein HDU97_004751 [Phlyctochytrium planicorne]
MAQTSFRSKQVLLRFEKSKDLKTEHQPQPWPQDSTIEYLAVQIAKGRMMAARDLFSSTPVAHQRRALKTGVRIAPMSTIAPSTKTLSIDVELFGGGKQVSSTKSKQTTKRTEAPSTMSSKNSASRSATLLSASTSARSVSSTQLLSTISISKAAGQSHTTLSVTRTESWTDDVENVKPKSTKSSTFTFSSSIRASSASKSTSLSKSLSSATRSSTTSTTSSKKSSSSTKSTTTTTSIKSTFTTVRSTQSSKTTALNRALTTNTVSKTEIRLRYTTRPTSGDYLPFDPYGDTNNVIGYFPSAEDNCTTATSSEYATATYLPGSPGAYMSSNAAVSIPELTQLRAVHELPYAYQVIATIVIAMSILEYFSYMIAFFYCLVQGVRHFQRPSWLTALMGFFFLVIRSVYIPIFWVSLSWLPLFPIPMELVSPVWKWFTFSFWICFALYFILMLLPVIVVAKNAIFTRPSKAISAGVLVSGENARHIVVIMPIYKELAETLLQATIAVAESRYPKLKLQIVLAMDEPAESTLYLQTRRNLDPQNKAVRTPGAEPAERFGNPLTFWFRDVCIIMCRFEHGGKRHTQQKAFELVDHLFKAETQPNSNPRDDPLILFLDSDIVVERTAIATMAGDIVIHDKSAVTGLLLCSNPEFNPWWIYQDVEYIQTQILERGLENACGGVTCMPGAFTMVRLSALRTIAPAYFQTPYDLAVSQSQSRPSSLQGTPQDPNRNSLRIQTNRQDSVGPAPQPPQKTGEKEKDRSSKTMKKISLSLYLYILLYLGEDRFFTRLLLEKEAKDGGDGELGVGQSGGTFSVAQVDAAVGRTVGPSSWRLFLMQRRRWFLGTVSNEACLLCSQNIWTQYPLLATLRLLNISLRSMGLLVYVLFISVIIMFAQYSSASESVEIITLVPAGILILPFILNWASYCYLAIRLKRLKLFLYPVFYLVHPIIAWTIIIYSFFTCMSRSWGGNREDNGIEESMNQTLDSDSIIAMYSEDYNKTVYRNTREIPPLILPPPPAKSSLSKNPRFVENSSSFNSLDSGDPIIEATASATTVCDLPSTIHSAFSLNTTGSANPPLPLPSTCFTPTPRTPRTPGGGKRVRFENAGQGPGAININDLATTHGTKTDAPQEPKEHIILPVPTPYPDETAIAGSFVAIKGPRPTQYENTPVEETGQQVPDELKSPESSTTAAALNPPSRILTYLSGSDSENLTRTLALPSTVTSTSTASHLSISTTVTSHLSISPDPDDMADPSAHRQQRHPLSICTNGGESVDEIVLEEVDEEMRPGLHPSAEAPSLPTIEVVSPIYLNRDGTFFPPHQ